MPSFREISPHFPALVIDAASSLVQVGILERGVEPRWQARRDEAGIAIFQAVEALGVAIAAMRSFVFCEGPGSILGIRTAAMAIRTWNVLEPRPVFAYCSLALLAHALGREDATVIADARRDTWHAFQLGTGLRRLRASELSGELFVPEDFRHWSEPPGHVTRLSYDLSRILPTIWEKNVLGGTDAPDAFLHEDPAYVTWTPQIHRAPKPRTQD